MIDMTGSQPVTETVSSWFKSSYSDNSLGCLEIRFAADAVLVRDSKNPMHGPTLAVTTAQWAAFLDGLVDSP